MTDSPNTLLAAGQRCTAVAQQVGGVALLVDARDPSAAIWYKRFGAMELLDDPLSLMLPLATLRRLADL